jgi:hypothetical protein
MEYLPILGPSHEWFPLKKAVDYSGLADRTLRHWSKIHGIGRQSGKGKIEISIVALEMVRCNDFVSIELLRGGQRSHPRVRHYVERLTELGVFSRSKVTLATKPLPNAANPNSAPEVLLLDQGSGSLNGPVAPDITTSREREIEQMTDEGVHARIAVRIRTILRSKDGTEMPPLAEHLAFDTDLSEAESLKILEIAAKERRSQIAALAEAKRVGIQ